MTNEELVALIQTSVDVMENMETLYNQNNGLIRKIVNGFAAYFEVEDLMQEAYIALHNAVCDYDANIGIPFHNYAANRIRWHLSRYTKENGHLKRLPEYVVKLMANVQKYENDYYAEYGEEPTDYQIQMELGLSAKKLASIRKNMTERYCISFDAPVCDDDDLCLGDTIEDPSDLEDAILDKIENEEKMVALWGAVMQLPDNQKFVIMNYYRYQRSIRCIAEMLNISIEKARSLKRKGFDLLRRKDSVQRLKSTAPYIMSGMYRTSLASFREHRMSATERCALRMIEMAEADKALKARIEKMRCQIC